MNTWQACRRIQSVLRARLWGGTGDNVFPVNSVRVTIQPADIFASDLITPVAFVRPLDSRADEEEPTLIEQKISVVVLVSIAGDMVGESTLMGANRASATSNEGRGILEIETELLDEIAHLNAGSQFRIAHQFDSSVIAAIDEETGYHLWREYTFSAKVTASKQFQEPRAVTLSEAAGTVTISWTAPDDVTNLTGYIVRRTASNIPVAYPTSGTDVAWTVGLSTTDAPGAGTYTYSVFAAYDEEGGAVEHDVSDYSYAEITFV